MKFFKISFMKLAISLLICFSAAFIGSLFTFPSISTWYESLNKPFFTPPNWVFGPVWTILYLLMAISLYLIWEDKNVKDKKMAYYFFGFQLFLNTLWSIIFFGLKSPFLGFIIIIVFWIAIFLMIWKFFEINKLAGYIQIPYILWASFASILNLAIVLLN